MDRHPISDYRILTCVDPPGDERTFIAVAIDGFPGWVVEAVIVTTNAGAGVSAQFIYPRQDDGYGVGRPATIGLKRYLDAMYDGLLIEESVRVSVPDVLNRIGPPSVIPQELHRAISHRNLVKLARHVALERAEFAAGVADVLSGAEAISLVARQAGPLFRRSASHNRSLTKPVTRAGRKGNGIAHYLDWAMQYHELAEAGENQVVKILHHRHGEMGKKRNYIRDTIGDIRRQDLLTRPVKGKAGGELTDHAIELLEDIDPNEIKGPEWDAYRLNEFVARRARILEMRVS
jgi:hypothetical protein